MSRVKRTPAFYVCENEDTDNLHGTSNCGADQHLCFHYLDNTIPVHSKSEISIQPGMCRTWSETSKTGFLTVRLRDNFGS